MFGIPSTCRQAYHKALTVPAKRPAQLWRAYHSREKNVLIASVKLRSYSGDACTSCGRRTGAGELILIVSTCRRAYHKALTVPGKHLDQLWRAYEDFERSSSNAQLARREVDEQRPRYQAAKGAAAERARLQQNLMIYNLAVPPGERLVRDLLCRRKG